MWKYIKNSLCASFFWAIYNFLFLIVSIVLDFRVKEINDVEKIHDTYVVSFWIIFLLIGVSLWGFYNIGKYLLSETRNIFTDFISIIIMHCFILYLVFLMIESEHTMIITINWFDVIFEKAFVSSYAEPVLYYSFIANSFISFIPYIFIFIGLLKQKYEKSANTNRKNKEKHRGRF